jgi:hypothetical protein
LFQVRRVRVAEVPDAVGSEVDERVAVESQAGVFAAAQRGKAIDRGMVDDSRGEPADDVLDPGQQACLLRRE